MAGQQREAEECTATKPTRSHLYNTTDNANNRIACLYLNYMSQRFAKFTRTGDQFTTAYSPDNKTWYNMSTSSLWKHYTDGVKTDVTGDDGIIFWAGTAMSEAFWGVVGNFQDLYDGSESFRLLYLAQNEP